ncbi:hypothetical protein [Streptomyces chattanoogensis]|uniref:hypothetical protein n=1 Tax=Streptomyces chattanoogensis TaxID=66876 RepID=UPI003694913B
MTDSTRSALRLALSLAGPETADALAERLRPELPAVLADRFGLPEEMVEELLGADPAQMRAALDIDPREWLLGAAELGDPVVGLALWHAWYRDDSGHQWRAMAVIPDLLATLLGAADLSDPRWYEDDGLFQELHEVISGPLLVAVLTSGFLGVTLGSLALFGVHLPPPAVVDVCLRFQALWGTEAFSRFLGLLEDVPELDTGHPWLPDLLRRTLEAPDPESFLREQRPAGWEDPEHLRAMLELRYGDSWLEFHSGRGFPARPDGLDWDLIRREHERRPVGLVEGEEEESSRAAGLIRLVQWEGCPHDLVMESFGRSPWETAEHAAELPFEAFTKPVEYPASVYCRTLSDGLRAGRLPVERLLAEAIPAEDVLWHLPDDHEPTRRALTGLVARLGTNPVNWLTCYARMQRARTSSVAELIEDAVRTDTRRKRYTSWPRPEEADGLTSFSRRAFLAMFRCASEEAQLAVVPYLDPRGVQDFLVHGEPSPAVREAVVAAHGLPAQVAMAASDDLSAEQLDYLRDLDEPAVNARLFGCTSIFGTPLLERPERERLLAGLLGNADGRPVPGELLAVLERQLQGRDRSWLTSFLESGDVAVARTILTEQQLRIPATRLRLLAAVWERGGPDAVREILAMDRLPVTLRRRTEKLLDTPDGLERLRAQLAEEETPDRLLAFLTSAPRRPGKQLQRLLDEGLEPPWSALVAAQTAGTLPVGLLGPLVELPDCPRELLLAMLATDPTYGKSDRDGQTGWIRDALRSARLTSDDILSHAAPAREALALLRCHTGDRTGAPDGQPARKLGAALAQEHLAADAEAWAVCLQLLPTFAGTLPELLTTAGAVTRRQQ